MRPKSLFIIAVAALMALSGLTAGAQNKFAVKTNLLHDATMTLDLGAEWAFAPKWSVELSGSWHPYFMDVTDVKLQHVFVQPEVKYWFCERFQGAFVGAHVLGGTFVAGCFPIDFSTQFDNGVNFNNFGLDGKFAIGGGLNVGYDFILGRHWNLELELGLGYVFAKGDEYSLAADADGGHDFRPGATDWQAANTPTYANYLYDYVGPTTLAVSLVYIF